MKNAALQWLSRDPLLHVCMSESIRRGHAEVLYAGQDGVLLRDPVAETMQASFESPAALEPWVDAIAQSGLDVVVHQDFAEEFLAPALPERAGRMRCYHSVYTGKQPLDAALPREAHIEPLDGRWTEAVQTVYKHASAEYIAGRIEAGVMLGIFWGGELAGFIGQHTEGALGMLEVLPEYRRRGLARALMAAGINAALARGETPFGQIVTTNEPSLALSRSMGLQISQGVVVWMFR